MTARRYKGTILDARAEGLDELGGRWYAACARHGTTVANRTKADAKSSAADTREFCDDCREEDTE